jgi:ParG
MAKHDIRQVKPVTSSEEWSHKSRDPTRALAAEPGEPMKRLTIDVPLSLHTRLKTMCASSGQKIADVVRDLITAHLRK